MSVTDSAVTAGADALWLAFPTLRDEYTWDWFLKVSRIVLESQPTQGD
jgi:hypothetical protein